METSLKVIVTSKTKLQKKYNADFAQLEDLFQILIESDKLKDLETHLLYIDDSDSCTPLRLTSVSSITEPACKQAIDRLYQALSPAYIVIFGAQDIIPFQTLENPVNGDRDSSVPTDLPYACEAPYSMDFTTFLGPTRVVGRIPDIPFKVDMPYLNILFNSIINHKALPLEEMLDYFSVTTYTWQKSTEMNMTEIFGNSSKLQVSPAAGDSYTNDNLRPLIHFYNCHGGPPSDPKFYGEKDEATNLAMHSSYLDSAISPGTIVVSECCYGAQLYEPKYQIKDYSIANNYFKNGAIAFLGSGTVCFGPPDSLDYADLLTQYFLKNIKKGHSCGRALLEARQNYLISSPTKDALEQKTFIQFYLLGDPSLSPVISQTLNNNFETVGNRRMNLFDKGVNLGNTISPSILVKNLDENFASSKNDITEALESAGFTGNERQYLYRVRVKVDGKKENSNAKITFQEGDITYRNFIKDTGQGERIKMLVVKESASAVLGWKVVYSK